MEQMLAAPKTGAGKWFTERGLPITDVVAEEQAGERRIAQTGLYRLHREEAVLAAPEAERYRRGGLGGRGDNFYMTVNAPPGATVPEMASLCRMVFEQMARKA
jgi:hypothetical protein